MTRPTHRHICQACGTDWIDNAPGYEPGPYDECPQCLADLADEYWTAREHATASKTNDTNRADQAPERF